MTGGRAGGLEGEREEECGLFLGAHQGAEAGDEAGNLVPLVPLVVLPRLPSLETRPRRSGSRWPLFSDSRFLLLPPTFWPFHPSSWVLPLMLSDIVPGRQAKRDANVEIQNRKECHEYGGLIASEADVDGDAE